MNTPILRTKLYFLTPRTSLVPRPHLVGRRQLGLQGHPTLISMTAGSGKTTLLSEWHRSAAARTPVAWLSLDANSGIRSEYVTRLLAAFSAQETKPATPAKTPSLLSQRELELLKLIAVGRTNRKIAGELFIAIGTVKGHTVNIFTKLDVANRTEAVVKARQIGLVQ